jgi:hypothetical protein
VGMSISGIMQTIVVDDAETTAASCP